MKPATPYAQARARERGALRASTRTQFDAVGSFVSSASRIRLLGALKRLKPHLNARLRLLERDQRQQRYAVEIDVRDLHSEHAIDVWLGVKCALTSAFPPHKPGAVRRLEP